MDKYIGFDIDSNKTVACVVENGVFSNGFTKTYEKTAEIFAKIPLGVPYYQGSQ